METENSIYRKIMVRHESEVEVRYYETDQMGIVHHSNYIRYFECGRTKMMKDFNLPVEQIEAEGVMLAVIGVECHYRLPARMGDTLKVVCIIDREPLAKLVIKNEIYNQKGELLVYGSVTLAFLDARTRRPCRCPESLTKAIMAHIQ